MTKMEQRHFEFIADAIKYMDNYIVGDRYTKEQIAAYFAGRLSSTNARFNKDRFLRACAKASDQ